MIEAKNVNWGDIKALAEDLAKKGFKADRDLTEFILRKDLVTVVIYVDRKCNGDFKQVRGVIRLDFADYRTPGFSRAYEAKPFKGLSSIYEDALIGAAEKIEDSFRAAFAATSSHVASIDPKRIMQQENNHVCG